MKGEKPQPALPRLLQLGLHHLLHCRPARSQRRRDSGRTSASASTRAMAMQTESGKWQSGACTGKRDRDCALVDPLGVCIGVDAAAQAILSFLCSLALLAPVLLPVPKSQGGVV